MAAGPRSGKSIPVKGARWPILKRFTISNIPTPSTSVGCQAGWIVKLAELGDLDGASRLIFPACIGRGKVGPLPVILVVTLVRAFAVSLSDAYQTTHTSYRSTDYTVARWL